MSKQLRGKRESKPDEKALVLQKPGNASVACNSILKEREDGKKNTNKLERFQALGDCIAVSSLG
jgi:hypothetical protein